jgi:hypothetical protein
MEMKKLYSKRQKGCEWESPLFRQIMAKKEKDMPGFEGTWKALDNLVDYKPKRGKYNGREQR